MNKTVAFFYPTKNIGGAQNLFFRAAKYLVSKNYLVYNIDYGSSYITKQLNADNINFEHVIIDKAESKKVLLPDDITFIVSLSYIEKIADHFSDNRKLRFVFWDLHPNNLIDHTFFSFFYKKKLPLSLKCVLKSIEKQRIEKLGRFIQLANKNNSLLFMCKGNYLFNHAFFNLDIKPSYLPIIQDPLIQSLSDSDDLVMPNNEVNIAWLSRLEPDKVAILNLLIQDCEKYASQKKRKVKVNLHVIGEGSAVEQVMPARHCNLLFTGKLFNTELCSYLKTNVDVGFSMGTSSLEFAARGIPSVLVPSSTLPDYFKKRIKRYMWLHQVEGYDVATEMYHEKGTLKDLDTILDCLISGDQRLGVCALNYVRNNHSLVKVGEKLCATIEASSFTLEDIFSTGIYSRTKFERILKVAKDNFKNISMIY